MKVTQNNLKATLPLFEQLNDLVPETRAKLRELSQLSTRTLREMGWEVETDEDTEALILELDDLGYHVAQLYPAMEEWVKIQEDLTRYGYSRDDWTNGRISQFRSKIDLHLPQAERHLRKFTEQLGFWPDK